MKSQELFEKMAEVLTESDSLKECLDAAIMLTASVIAQGDADMDSTAVGWVVESMKTFIPEFRKQYGMQECSESALPEALEKIHDINGKLLDTSISIDQIIDEHITCGTPELREYVFNQLTELRNQRLNQKHEQV